MPLPPGSDDAISPRSPLRPPRKSFAFALRTAVSPPGRCIGTREYSNVKPLRFRDTALAVLLRYLLQLRCCTPLPLCYTLFQRLTLLSDTSLVQSAFRQSLLAPFSTASRIVTIIASFPLGGALALFAYGSVDYSLSAVRRGTNSIPPMTASAALLSSFVRTVLTWRHRTVTSNCKQPDDTSSAVSPLIA